MQFTYVARCLALVVVSCLHAISAHAAVNLIANAGFDLDTGGWSKNNLALHNFEWSPVDAGGSAASGSLRIYDIQPNRTNFVYLCVPVTGDTAYVMGASFYAPDGSPFQPASPNLRFHSVPGCGGLSETPTQPRDWAALGTSNWGDSQVTAISPPWAQSIAIFLRVGDSASEAFIDDVYLYEDVTCAETDGFMCLNAGRFRVSADWSTIKDGPGHGQGIPLTTDSGYFWFFGPNNIEVVIKVLNGCTISDHFWVFAAGLTDVEVDLQVTDTVTGAVWQSRNPQSQAFIPIQDTAAFATCP